MGKLEHRGVLPRSPEGLLWVHMVVRGGDVIPILVAIATFWLVVRALANEHQPPPNPALDTLKYEDFFDD